VPSLIYSFAQLEAFTAVAEHGSLAKAALKLGKDRTTLRDLIDFLEDGLGYALFLREGRSLHLTPEGEQLQRQAHLLMRQVKAFEAFAKDVPKSAAQEISLVYDPFTPRALLQALIAAMAQRNTRLSLINASRDEAERLLASGQADLGICQARNRSVGDAMEWRAACKFPGTLSSPTNWKCCAPCSNKAAAGDSCRRTCMPNSGKTSTRCAPKWAARGSAKPW
ncbi:HTH-type transcriptional activator AllS, partial [Serratia marcescens]